MLVINKQKGDKPCWVNLFVLWLLDFFTLGWAARYRLVTNTPETSFLLKKFLVV